MSQCVPSCVAEPSTTPSAHPPVQQQPSTPHIRMRRSPDYEEPELTWKNSHLAMRGHLQHRVGKPIPRYPSPASWDKPSAGNTLESLVDQATRAAQSPIPTDCEHGKGISVVAALDALVPCSIRRPPGDNHSGCVPEQASGLSGTGVGPCSGRKRAKVGLWAANYGASGSAASMALTCDTCQLNGGDEVGLTTSANPVEGSRETENTSSAKQLTVVDDRMSVCHSMDGAQTQRDGCGNEEKTITMAKSSRTASVHNQSERNRRDRINQRMKTLQKLVPNCSKTDKASMLDEVIEYLKQLQAQVQMMSRMNSIPHMMMQQFQMSWMAQMAQMAQMGMGMGMVDMNSFTRPVNSGILPLLQPSPFVPFPVPWDGCSGNDWLPTSGGMALPTPGGYVVPESFSAFMACQTQHPMNLEAFNRMATLHQQRLYQQFPTSNPKT